MPRIARCGTRASARNRRYPPGCRAQARMLRRNGAGGRRCRLRSHDCAGRRAAWSSLEDGSTETEPPERIAVVEQIYPSFALEDMRIALHVGIPLARRAFQAQRVVVSRPGRAIGRPCMADAIG